MTSVYMTIHFSFLVNYDVIHLLLPTEHALGNVYTVRLGSLPTSGWFQHHASEAVHGSTHHRHIPAGHHRVSVLPLASETAVPSLGPEVTSRAAVLRDVRRARRHDAHATCAQSLSQAGRKTLAEHGCRQHGVESLVTSRQHDVEFLVTSR